MTQRIISITLLVLIAMKFISNFHYFAFLITPMMVLITTIAYYCSVFLVVQSGTLWRNKILTTITGLAILFYGIGMCFKIMHWPGANEFMLFSLSSFGIIYGFHFIKKTTKAMLDWWKFLWLIALILSSTILPLNEDLRQPLLIAEQVIWVLLFIYFISTEVWGLGVKVADKSSPS